MQGQQVSIRLYLESASNKHTLDVTSDKFGVLHYRLYTTLGYTPEALSNIGCKQTFPDCIDGYRDVDMLLTSIRATIGTGYARVKEVAYAKAVPLTCSHCGKPT